MWLKESRQQVLITGGSGFIGHALCARLASEGHHITVLTRNRQRARQRITPSVELIESLDELASQARFHTLINLAGEPIAERRWTDRRKAECYRSRIDTTNALLAFFKKQQSAPLVLVNGSAIGYYGPHNDELLDESGHGVPSFSHMLCRDWEAAADRFAALGCRVCKIRTGIVLGPGGGALASMLPAFRWGLGGPIGSGQQWMSWIHREDLLRLICHCINHETLQGAINGTAPNPVRNNEFSQCLGRVLSRPARLRVPALMMRLVFGEMADELLLSGQQVVPACALESGFEFLFPELPLALQDIFGAS